MTERVRIVPNALASATASATTEASPAAHLLNMLREEVWHSDTYTPGLIADQRISLPLPQPVFVDTLALDRHNLGGTATWSALLLLGADEVYSSGPLTAGIPVPAGVWRAGIDPIGATYNDRLDSKTARHLLPSPVLTDLIHIDISDATNPAGYLEVCRIVAGLALQLQNNISWGATSDVVDKTEHLRTGGGSMRSNAGNIYRRQVLPLDYMTDSDRVQLLAELSRKAQDLFVSVYPNAASGMTEIMHQFIARRVSDHSTRRTNALFAQGAITLEEI